MASVNQSRFHYRTWIEINRAACRENYKTFRRLIGPKVKLWSVVKSNAYGHGIFVFSKLMNSLGIDGFCVDSLIEGVKLRRSGIKKHILVLGPTLPNLLSVAREHHITLSVSNFESLKSLVGKSNPPNFHIKIDTGMHRQGFYPSDVPKLIRSLERSGAKSALSGIYTHFAAAKDMKHQMYTEKQLLLFYRVVAMFERAGFKDLVKHCAATGATLMDRKYHLNAVRVGIGLYGLWPSEELEAQLRRSDGGRNPDPKASGLRKIDLQPVLSWRTVVTEVKALERGDYVGYDLAGRVTRSTRMAVLPVGYWHGFPRLLSNTGEILLRGRKGKILGRVSMDMLAADVNGIGARVGDVVTLIGKDGKKELRAGDVARKAATTHYELLTRLNPLMERIVT